MLGWCKVGFARAYSFALYADTNALSKLISLKKHSHSTDDTLSVYLKDKLSSNVGEISLVLSMARDISGEHLAHGFRNSVLKRLKKNNESIISSGATNEFNNIISEEWKTQALMTGKASMSGNSDVSLPKNTSTSSGLDVQFEGTAVDKTTSSLLEVMKFAKAFEGLKILTGEDILFIWGENGQMKTLISQSILKRKNSEPSNSNKTNSSLGIAAGSGTYVLLENACISDINVSRALFDVYCGDIKTVVSARAKTTFEKNISTISEINDLSTDAILKIVVDEHESRRK